MGMVSYGPESWKGPPTSDGPEPPDNDGMEARIKALETDMKDVRERAIKIEAKIDSLASKSDVSEAKSAIILWVVAAIFLAQLLPSLLKRFGI